MVRLLVFSSAMFILVFLMVKEKRFVLNKRCEEKYKDTE